MARRRSYWVSEMTFHSTFVKAGCIRSSWCDPFKTWQKVSLVGQSCRLVGKLTSGQSYTFDPLENLADTETNLVLGGGFALCVNDGKF